MINVYKNIRGKILVTIIILYYSLKCNPSKSAMRAYRIKMAHSTVHPIVKYNIIVFYPLHVVYQHKIILHIHFSNIMDCIFIFI